MTARGVRGGCADRASPPLGGRAPSARPPRGRVESQRGPGCAGSRPRTLSGGRGGSLQRRGGSPAGDCTLLACLDVTLSNEKAPSHSRPCRRPDARDRPPAPLWKPPTAADRRFLSLLATPPGQTPPASTQQHLGKVKRWRGRRGRQAPSSGSAGAGGSASGSPGRTAAGLAAGKAASRPATLRAGVHPKLVQEVMRHSSYTTTADTYTHVMPTHSAEAVEAVAALFQVTAPAGRQR